jgi:hypothetical protein
MKKLKLQAGEFTSTQKPQSEYVIRLERSGDALLARYFKALPREQHDHENIATELPEFSSTATTLLRLTVTNKNFIEPAAVTAHPAFVGKVLTEIGRHIFRPTLNANSVCGAGERQDFAAFVLPFGSNGAVAEPYNHFTESMNVKGVTPRNGRLRGGQPIFILYSDVADAALDDWTLIYADSQPFVLEDMTGGAWQNAPANFSLYGLLPTVSVGAPATVNADATATANVTLSRDGVTIAYSGELALEAVSGYLPKQRVTISNGTGSFKAMALGLETGDAMRIKVGTRCISGLAEANVTIA